MKTPIKTLLALLLFTLLIHPAFADTLIRPGDFPAGLQGWWKLDEASGTRVDSSGNDNHLADINTVASVVDDYWATGERSADFEQDNGEALTISHAAQSGLSINGPFSFSCFFKSESTAGGLMMKKYDGANGFYMLLESTHQLRCLFNSGSGSPDLITTTTVPAGQWNHTVFVFDGSHMIIYLNGNVIATRAETRVPNPNSAAFELGSTFDGLMKDAAVWDRALTPIEVKSLAFGVDLQTLAFRPNSLPLAPAGFWRLNEVSSGASAVTRADSSGNGLTLTDNNNVPTAKGYIEGASARFTSASSQYLSRPHASGNPLDVQGTEQSITLMAWIYSSGSGNLIASDVIMDKLAAAGGYALQLQSPNFKTIEFVLRDGAGNLTIATSAAAVNQNGWHHVAGVYDAATNTMQVYVDGVASGNPVTQSAGIGGSTSEFRIAGRVTSDSTIMWDGSLADVAVFSTALSASQIASIATGLPVQRSGVVSYWNLDETSGTRADSIGANNLSSNNGVGSAAGVVGNAARFVRSSSQSLKITDAVQSGLDIDDDITVLYWGKVASPAVQYVLSKRAQSSTTGYGTAITESNILKFNVNATDWVFTGSLGLSSFFHGAFAFDGAKARAFFNSALQNEFATTTRSVENNLDFVLGGGPDNQYYFDGLMDEVIVARRWFRDEEIKAIYNNGLNGQPALFTDTDGDGIPDEFETGTGVHVSPRNTGTDPANPDTDGDGLTDGQEVNIYHTNPNLTDTDGDGFTDAFEISTGFNPTSAASTPESLSRILPAVEYQFNAALGVSYRIEASFDLQTWTTIETPIIGNGGEIARLYSIQGQPKRFFRSRRN